MSDLELLDLLDRAKQNNRGPQGEAGIGITEINQADDKSFTVVLSNGRTFPISLPQPRDGIDGAPGRDGERGPEGPPGRAGAAGSSVTGRQGVPGDPGRDGTSLDTAIVNREGHLILGLTDGTVIDAGRVVGPPGTGERGPIGLSGRDGSDGAAVLSGPRAPQDSDGKDGDHWIDLSTPEYGFFKRTSGAWTKLASLRIPPGNVGGKMTPAAGGGAGGGSGGGGELQNTRTLPLVNGGADLRKKAAAKALPPMPGTMKSQEDANLYFLEALRSGASGGAHVGVAAPPPPYTAGQLWFSTEDTELTLFIYDGNDWVVASPPVSLDGIESNIFELEENVQYIQKNMTPFEAHQELYGKHQALEEDQARQDRQIVELEEEIEALAPTFDRGKWTFVESENVGPGEYTMGAAVDSGYCIDQFEKCLAAIPGAPNQNEMDPAAIAECNRLAAVCETAKEKGELFMADWAHAAFLHFHKTDVDGKGHTFDDCKVGQYIDLFDQDDDNYALFEVTEAPIKEGDVYKIGVSPIKHHGEASGVVRVKIFEMAAADPTEYVRKAGDTITGPLRLYPDSTSNPLTVNAFDEGSDRSIVVNVRGKTGSDGKRPSIFTVVADGSVNIDDDVRITSKWQVPHKKYVDEAIAEAIKNIQFPTVAEPGPAQLCWEYRKPSSGKGPAAGTFWLDSSHFRMSMMTKNGVNLAYGYPSAKDEWWFPAAEKYDARALMTIWKKYSGGWKFFNHFELDKTRWVLTTDGITHFQFRKTWDSHKLSFGTGTIYYITVGGFF